MSNSWLGYLAGALTAGCVLPYLRDIGKGRTVPHRTSWLIFAGIAVISAAAQLSAGADAGALLAFGSAVGFSAVFIVSIRRGTGGATRSDGVVLACAIAALATWAVTSEPLTALVAIIATEIGAIYLTVLKGYRSPGTETLATWVIDALAGAVSIAAVGAVSTTQLIYPVYHLLANAAVVLAILIGRRRSGVMSGA